jgi:hypothetical protein
MESSLYAGGEDEFVKEIERKGVAAEAEIVPSRSDNTKSGVFHLPGGLSVGAAMCWEQVRYRTARRMRDQVDLVFTASGWPAGNGDPKIVETPRRLARLVGGPVIHASIVESGSERRSGRWHRIADVAVFRRKPDRGRLRKERRHPPLLGRLRRARGRDRTRTSHAV